jgi:hypothetical protein
MDVCLVKDEALVEGVALYGFGKWKLILADAEYGIRLRFKNNADLRNRWKAVAREAPPRVGQFHFPFTHSLTHHSISSFHGMSCHVLIALIKLLGDPKYIPIPPNEMHIRNPYFIDGTMARASPSQPSHQQHHQQPHQSVTLQTLEQHHQQQQLHTAQPLAHYGGVTGGIPSSQPNNNISQQLQHSGYVSNITGGIPSASSGSMTRVQYGNAEQLSNHIDHSMVPYLALRRRQMLSSIIDTPGVHEYHHQFVKPPATIFKMASPYAPNDAHNNSQYVNVNPSLINEYKMHSNDIVSLAEEVNTNVAVTLADIYNICHYQLGINDDTTLSLCHQIIQPPPQPISSSSTDTTSTSTSSASSHAASRRRALLSNTIYNHLDNNESIRASLRSRLPGMLPVRRRIAGRGAAHIRVAPMPSYPMSSTYPAMLGSYPGMPPSSSNHAMPSYPQSLPSSTTSTSMSGNGSSMYPSMSTLDDDAPIDPLLFQQLMSQSDDMSLASVPLPIPSSSSGAMLASTTLIPSTTTTTRTTVGSGNVSATTSTDEAALRIKLRRPSATPSSSPSSNDPTATSTSANVLRLPRRAAPVTTAIPTPPTANLTAPVHAAAVAGGNKFKLKRNAANNGVSLMTSSTNAPH